MQRLWRGEEAFLMLEFVAISGVWKVMRAYFVILQTLCLSDKPALGWKEKVLFNQNDPEVRALILFQGWLHLTKISLVNLMQY